MEETMHHAKKIGIVAVLIVAIAVFSGSIFSQVARHPNPKDNLIARWDWAKKEAGQQNLEHGFWIGYSIKRLMREDQYIYSTDKYTMSGSHFTNFPKGDPLENILSDEEQVKHEAKKTLIVWRSRKSLKTRSGKMSPSFISLFRTLRKFR